MHRHAFSDLSVFARAAAACFFVLAPTAWGQDSPNETNLPLSPSIIGDLDKSVRGWCSRVWSGQADVGWSIATSSRTGKHCLSISSGKEGSDAAWWTIVTVEPHTRYELSGWIKTKDIHGAVGALLTVDMPHVRTPALNGTQDWTRVSTVFRTGSDTTLEVFCLYGGWGRSTGQAWYDEVSLVEVKTAEAPEATVTIETGTGGVAYNPMIFGGFIEHFHRQIYGGLFEPGSPLSDEHGFRADVIEAMRELELSVVRWPGGCFASGYHWKDGVGPARKPVADPVWGVTDPNTFGTDEFITWCRLVGCEPYICTNAGNGTPEEMKQWVEYCNATQGDYAELRKAGGNDQPFDVRMWSVGNENWGQHEIGASTPEKWGPLVNRSAELMRQVDPDLKLAAAATPDRTWTLPLLKAAGDQLQYVAVHKYWFLLFEQNATPDYMTCILHSVDPDRTIAGVTAVLDEAGYRGRIKIAFDEWNLRGWHHPGFPRKSPVDPNDKEAANLIAARAINEVADQYTMADALFSASFFNACLRNANDVAMANIAPIVNDRGPLYVHPKGIVKRTTFHTLAMYANLLESHVVKTDITADRLTQGDQSVAVVDAVATVNDSGEKWAIALVNRHPKEHVACTVDLKGVSLNGKYDATVLSGGSPDAFNSIEAPARVVPRERQLTFDRNSVKLPPHSLTIVEVVVF
jgi:alpha-N-arabinofuranosidase